MKAIQNEAAYQKAIVRIEELLLIVDNNTPKTNKYFIELDELSDIVANYEEEHYPVDVPTLIEVIRLRMFEMNLKQKDLAELLGTSATRVSEYLKGKRQITMDVAKALYKKLNIAPELILS